MRFNTTNYEDFGTLVNMLFGDVCSVGFGSRPDSKQEIMVFATDRIAVVIYESNYGLPEDFHNNFPKARQIHDIHRLRIE